MSQQKHNYIVKGAQIYSQSLHDKESSNGSGIFLRKVSATTTFLCPLKAGPAACLITQIFVFCFVPYVHQLLTLIACYT